MAYDRQREIQEAIEAGQRAKYKLELARDQLRSAGNWGLVDLFGGGFFTTMIKHGKMGDAQRLIEDAKAELRSFSRELADVDEFQEIGINMGDFLSFADYFFDGFIVDWMVQSKISRAREQVEEAILRVDQILSRLRIM
ncbi:hypothetical protein [Shuttleworthella satelles]|uniref:Uncharacterized protein n=1 Tax=Shuttleworthella satelles DSM 14600 TaxID=626523 RepID=C4GDL5_9FIRM|nr:hypothetical protein [Shuttleworthia satelles]EEP27494.1 hypothetical protein GCWU000342_02188 [Shuttleworthia satelles DSM 14600]